MTAVASHSAPAAAQPNAAITKITRLEAMTRTPSDAAASSSSRIAWIAVPSPLRSRMNMTTRNSAIAPSVAQ